MLQPRDWFGIGLRIAVNTVACNKTRPPSLEFILNIYKLDNTSRTILLTTLDPNTREVVLLYHPRKDNWNDHFVMDGYYIRGITQIGIATEKLLKFNSDERVEMRSEIDPAS